MGLVPGSPWILPVLPLGFEGPSKDRMPILCASTLDGKAPGADHGIDTDEPGVQADAFTFDGARLKREGCTIQGRKCNG
jgi:hypothetical protein